MLINSGIVGFNDLLFGGFIKNSAILVEGVPGAGKTTMGLEFIYKGIIEMNEPGIVITFEEFPEQLYRDAANYGWDLRQLEEKDLLRVICTSPEIILDDSIGFLEDVVKEISAQRLLLDSVTQLNMEFNNPSELRKSVYGLCSGFRRIGLTTILTKEVNDYGSQISTFEEYLVDTVIRLHFEESYRFRRRYIEVLKSRGQDFISGKYPFKFGTNGLEIVGVPQKGDLRELPISNMAEQLSSGVEGLDAILGGGFLKGTTIMVEGASGTGKSVLGLHYLLEGLRRKEKGLLVITEESASFISKYIHSFDISIDNLEYEKEFFLIDRVFSSTSLEEVINAVINKVKVNLIQRVVIDFVNTFIEFSDNLLVLKSQLRNLQNCLNAMGCTTILILNEDHGAIMSPLKTTISSLVQGEIYLSSNIRKGKLIRSLEIKKMKGQRYISGVHPAEINTAGMAVFKRLGGI
ncbi:MAG: ATPase domain-containing protein [Syntrophomonadaceae bacterium]|nr:ATPase domain-containing protein [Syntrophomonadaceae bacterium]